MARPKLGNRRLLPIELARESIDLAATGQGDFRDMLLKQPLIRIRPTRRASAVLPALRSVGDRQSLGACRDLALDDTEVALRFGLRDLHARKQEAPVPGLAGVLAHARREDAVECVGDGALAEVHGDEVCFHLWISFLSPSAR
ncbi:hypothetical protein ABIA94_008516 [Bradyrhizobium sp. LA7.1]